MSYIVFVFAAFFALLAVEGWRYEVQGARVTGVVLSKEPAAARSKPHVRYRFTTTEGQSVEGRSEVLSHNYRALREGGPVEVEYVSASPGTNRVQGQRARSAVFGAMTAAAIAGGVLLRRREKRGAARPADRAKRESGAPAIRRG